MQTSTLIHTTETHKRTHIHCTHAQLHIYTRIYTNHTYIKHNYTLTLKYTHIQNTRIISYTPEEHIHKHLSHTQHVSPYAQLQTTHTHTNKHATHVRLNEHLHTCTLSTLKHTHTLTHTHTHTQRHHTQKHTPKTNKHTSPHANTRTHHTQARIHTIHSHTYFEITDFVFCFLTTVLRRIFKIDKKKYFMSFKILKAHNANF